MVYKIKQRMMTLLPKFEVFNGDEELIMTMEGKFSFNSETSLLDIRGKELAKIKKKVFSFPPQYIVEIDGIELITIKKMVTLFKERYEIEGPGWEVKGDIFSLLYTINDGYRPIAEISKKAFSLSDSYEVRIDDNKDPLPILATVLAIDMERAKRN